MTIVVRPVGFTNSLQRLVWPQGTNIPVTAYLWGAGGGGGGNDSASGGAGSGGGFSQVNFTISAGDILDVAVGGGGGAGVSGRGGAPGGAAGASYSTDEVFSTLDIASSGSNFRYTNSAYCSFLNQNGIWNITPSAAVFDQTVNATFPTSGYYTFTGSCDNFGTIFVDGVNVLDIPTYTYVVSSQVYVTAGVHAIRIYGYNTGGPGAIGLTVVGGNSYSGGRGSAAGPSGSSGGGGGGGGASVVFLNGTELAVAAGGGGGGGGGNRGSSTGQSAPGSRGQAAPGTNAGQDGQSKGGDGGGAGGGGGGWGGGQGGEVRDGDQGGLAGSYGLSYGITADPDGRTPGGTSNQYWTSAAGLGGTATRPGNSGYIVFEFNIGGTFVHYDGSFAQVSNTWVKANNVWNPVRATYVKKDGVWSAVNGTFAPIFDSLANDWGTNPRAFS